MQIIRMRGAETLVGLEISAVLLALGFLGVADHWRKEVAVGR